MPAILLALLPAAAATAEPDLDALVARVARPAPQATAFVEVRYSKLLDAPLAVAGELRYGGPGQLAREVRAPFAETTTIAGEDVTIARGRDRPKRFSLKRAPELRGVLASFGALLAGDAETLRRYFTVATSGDDAHWQLVLTPRDAKMKKRVAVVTVDGAGDAPRCFTIREGDGDESVMRVGDAATLPAIGDAAAIARAAMTAACTAR